MMKKKLLLSLLTGLTVAFTWVLYPVLIFTLGNRGELWFKLTSVLPQLLLAFAAGTLCVGAIHLLLPDSRKSPRTLFAGLCAALCLCYDVQYNFLSGNLPVLTGDAIDWTLFRGESTVSLILWGGALALTLIVWIARHQWLRKVCYGLMGALLAVQCITLGTTFLTDQGQNIKNDSYFSREHIREVSEDENIVFLMSDTFEATFMTELLEESPEYRETLKDFTFYDNTTGVSSLTYLSCAKLLTGVGFSLGDTQEQGMARVFNENTLINTAAEKNWDIAYYTTFSGTDAVQGKIINYVSAERTPDWRTGWKAIGLLLKSTLFQGLPYPCKPALIVYTDDYSLLQEELPEAELPKAYTCNDAAFRKEIKKGLSMTAGKKRYQFLELNGVHAPYTKDRNFEKIEYDESVTVREKQLESARSALLLLTEYTDALKKAGAYDRTTIILCADHGFDMRFYPVLLVKEARGENEALQTDHTPLSMEEDYEKLLALMMDGKSFSEAVEQLAPPEDRVRHAYNFKATDGYGEKTDVQVDVEITGDARDPSSYHAVNEIFLRKDGFSGSYHPGDPMENLDNVMFYGINEDWYVFGPRCEIDIKPDAKIEGDGLFTAGVFNETEISQRISVAVCGQVLASQVLEPLTMNQLSVDIPAELLKQDVITVSMDLPDAVPLVMEDEVLGWSMYSSVSLDAMVLSEK